MLGLENCEPCIETTAHTKRKQFGLSSKKSLNYSLLSYSYVRYILFYHSIRPAYLRARQQILQRIHWLVVNANLVMKVWAS